MKPAKVIRISRFKAQGYIAITFRPGTIVRMDLVDARALLADLRGMLEGDVIEVIRREVGE